MTTHHNTFIIERKYPSSVERVFDAWADPKSKQSWFACHDTWTSEGYSLDFRPGGRETVDSIPDTGGPPHRYSALYYDIVPNERIVYSYDMYLGDVRITVSLATVEFIPNGDGTTMKFTEQIVVLDGHNDISDRITGTEAGLDSLGRFLSAS
jgi:uncharacterized protein YndB with AHSA1/START domain